MLAAMLAAHHIPGAHGTQCVGVLPSQVSLKM